MDYGLGASKNIIYEELNKIREEEYPTGDKGTIIFAKEVMEVLADLISGESANVCG